MKNIKNLKKKIFGITLVVGLLVLSIVGTTMAYFTDTDEKTYTFTSGNVDIQFDGAIFDSRVTAARPTQKLADAAVVKNIGSETAYVGIVITFDKAVAKASELFTNLGGVDFTVKYSEDKQNIFVVYNKETVKNDTIKFFDGVTVPAAWGNTEMTVFGAEGLNITVTAYATQTVGFTAGAVDALKTAFKDTNPVWNTMPTN
jgi:predicted ribosomally synthesized peptide with SipW-like signal peptide